jgi:hypothetical protein
MSHIRKSILGAAAITVSLAAAHFAFGQDLTVGMRTSGMPEQSIDRSAKADRASVFAEPVAPTQTISIHVDRVPDTSVLVRIPVARADQGGKDQGSATQGSANPGSTPEGNAAPAAQQIKDPRKATVACEPVVSVLTDIAKRLQPGRCIT